MADHPLSAIVRRLRGSVDAPDSDHQLLRRFADRRDEAAFAELVRRHGPTVWGVCRRGVPDPNDAEDVFQTTFLVLAKKPSAVGPGHSLGGWLHGVALRASAQARRGIVRRFAHEAEAARRNGVNASTSTNLSDGWLDEELRNLPARYRDPLVLCHIRGLGVAEAANELGCPANTVKTRLARGREMLKERLIRRGITAPAGVLAVAVPTELSASTIQLATDPGAIARPAVLARVSATLTGGFSMKLKLLTAAVVLACGVALTGVVLSGPPPGAKPTDKGEAPVKADIPPGEVAKPLARLDVDGVITEVRGKSKLGAAETVGSIIIGERKTGQYHVHIGVPGRFESKIVKLADGKHTPASFDDLKVGVRVQIMIQGDGGWMQSAPAQAFAAEVRILVPAEPVSLRGAVTSTAFNARQTTLRVEGEKAPDTVHSGAFVVTVNAATEVSVFVNGRFAKGTPDDVRKAARVEVNFDGSGTGKTDPPQATAKAIRILAEGVKKVHLRGPVTRVVETRSLEMRGEKADDCKYDGDFVVTLTDKTVFVKRVNGKDVPCDLAGVTVGARVEVEFFGDGVHLTDPPRSAAALVRVLPARADPLEGAAKPNAELPKVTSLLIVKEGLHIKGVAKTEALSIIEKGPIAKVMERFPNALVRQKGSDAPGGWEAEYRVYLFLDDGKVVMLTVGAKGSIWTAPATTGDLKTNGDFLGLVKELSE